MAWSEKPMRGRLDGPQVARGIASLLVLLAHSEFIAQAYLGGSIFGGRLLKGVHGADLFFVLSGFIMFWVHEPDFNRPSRLRTYATKRLLRIYPPYWVMLAGFVALLMLFPNTGEPWMRESRAIWSAVALVPYQNGSVLTVAWTLCYEMTFYVLFGIIILKRSVGFALLAVWLAASIIGRGSGSFPISFFTAPYAVHFTLGMATAYCVRNHSVRWPAAVLLSGIGLFMLSALVENALGKEVYGPWSYAVSSAVILAGLVTLSGRWPTILLVLGNASYSVYLVHQVLMAGTAPALARLPFGVSHVAAVAVGLGGGLLFYVIVERPFLRLVARRRHITPNVAVQSGALMAFRLFGAANSVSPEDQQSASSPSYPSVTGCESTADICGR